jgi:SWIM zinc finger
MNSTRNLAQHGVGHEISSLAAADFVNFYRGSNQRPFVTEYEDMEEARMAVSQYHMTLVTWNKPRGNDEHPGGNINDAVTNLRLDCTCHFFSRNAVYCEHILVICHKKGIINVNGEIRKLEPVHKAGRPKKRPHFLEKQSETEPGKYSKPSSVIGASVYDKSRGIGVVTGYNWGSSLFQVEFPRPHAKGKSLNVEMEATDVEVGRRKFGNKNWH